MNAIFTTYPHIFEFTYTAKLCAFVKLVIRNFLLGTQRKPVLSGERAIQTEYFLRQWSYWQQYIQNPSPSGRPVTTNYAGITDYPSGYFIPERAELVENLINVCCTQRDKQCLVCYYVAGMDTNEGAAYLRDNGFQCCDRRKFSEFRQLAFAKVEAALLLHVYTNRDELFAA